MDISRKLTYFIIITSLLLSNPIAFASFPIVRNFARTTYAAGPQNWAIAQTPNGTMLFGNSYGMLAFNSVNWQLYPVANGTPVRSILVDDASQRIYVGASGEFGYFYHNSDNEPFTYKSLRPTLRNPNTEFNEIWNIHLNNGKIWFQGDTKIFIFDGDNTIGIDTNRKISTSAVINDAFYIAYTDGGLAHISNESLNVSSIPTNSMPEGARICAILPYSETAILLVTQFHGLFVFDGNYCNSLPTDIDSFLKENQVFCASKSGTNLVFGTVNNGVVIKDIATDQNLYVNMHSGLQNNTVLSAAFDKSKNLWLGLDNGITYTLLNSPIMHLLGDGARYGAGYASFIDGNRMLLGTNQGLYTTSFPTTNAPAPQQLQPILKGQIWSIDSVGGSLFAATDMGLFQKTGSTFSQIHGIPGTISVTSLLGTPDKALVSTYNNFYIIQRDAAGRWTSKGKIDGYNDIGGYPIIDADQNIWLAHWVKGVFRLHLNTERQLFDRVDLFDSASGLPHNNNARPAIHNGEPIFSTSQGIYRYDKITDSIIPYTSLPEIYHNIGPSKIIDSGINHTWIISTDALILTSFDDNGNIKVDSTSLHYLTHKLIPGYESFNQISPKRAIVAGQDGFYDIDLTKLSTSKPLNTKVYITEIIADRDSLIYDNKFFNNAKQHIKLPFKLNTLRVSFIAPEYRDIDAVTYSYILENFDRDWSPYSTSTTKEYTRLPEGNYTFRVKARNTLSGTISEATIAISIAAPWYRTTTAKIIYLILIGIIICLGLYTFNYYTRLATRKVARQKEAQLEDLRETSAREALLKDYEIQRLKSEQLQHDIKHTSAELSNVTMNMIRKNEILMEISERLSKMIDTDAPTIDKQRLASQIDKLKKLIRENISHDDDWKAFTRNFDLVYENYLQRLVKQYPSLTIADQRICAYIKMGLSSKEIAPLLNISYRSVEMNRYRLRKKIGIPPEQSLADFLRTF